MCQHRATLNLLHIQAREVNRDPAAWNRGLFLFFMGLEAADTGVQAGRQDLQLVTDGQVPV